MSSRTMMEMFISSYYSKVLVPCLLSMNSHSSPQFSFGFTYIEFSTIRANNSIYKILSFAWYILHNCKSQSILKCKRDSFYSTQTWHTSLVGTFLHRWWWFMKIKFDDDKKRFRFFGCLLLFIIFFFGNTFFIRSLLFKLNSICFIKWKIL